ncbi:erythromycin esterase family protein [Myxococcus eversor]|uniref:erythromycin esterase family protein n=1 Tax=Myxococcus eversor TaxID=2709661 RepID=UPI001F086BD9|nr:erythromycin esterase family protein [Myxococcus eversor]
MAPRFGSVPTRARERRRLLVRASMRGGRISPPILCPFTADAPGLPCPVRPGRAPVVHPEVRVKVLCLPWLVLSLACAGTGAPRVPSASARALVDFFEQEAPAFHQRLLGPLAPFLDEKKGPEPLPVETGKQLAGLVADIDARLRLPPIRKRSEKARALVSRHARVLGQFAEVVVAPHSSTELRDRAMAENARWVLEHEGPEARMVLWAHNGHVCIADRGGSLSMGQHLREALGSGMYVFGFVFNQGSFQAVHMPSEPNEPRRGVIPHTVPSAEIGWLDGTLARAQVSAFALDLRGLPQEGGVSDFFVRPRYTRNYGAVFSKDIPPRVVRAAVAYDGLLFVDHTQAAIPTPTGRRLPPGQQAQGAP